MIVAGSFAEPLKRELLFPLINAKLRRLGSFIFWFHLRIDLDPNRLDYVTISTS